MLATARTCGDYARDLAAPTGRASIILLLCVLLISAAPNAKPDDLIREGNQAVEKGEYEAALRLLQDAEERGTDPGLIAFNKATAYWHRGNYRDAENHYRMALDDTAAPVDRRSKGFFNLANCLVKQAGNSDLRLLREAIRYYEYCLDLATEDGLRKDAKHNLELAKLLWNKARAGSANPPTPNSDEPPDTPKQPESKPKKDRDKSVEPGNKDGKESKKEIDKTKVEKGSDVPEPKSDPHKTDAPPKPGPGRVPVIPDTDKLVPQSAEDTQAALREAETRLNEIRKQLRKFAAIPENPSGKDW